MESVCILLAILGIILVISSGLIAKSSRKMDEKICKNKNLSDEEFERIRNEKVYKPEKWANWLFYIGITLQIPNVIQAIRSLLFHLI